MRSPCSCGRAEVELGTDLCGYCHAEHDERQMAWLNAQGPR